MKNPKTRFILFISIFIVEIVLVFLILKKNNFVIAWDEFFPGPLFFNLMMALSFGVQSWLAYRAMKKVA